MKKKKPNKKINKLSTKETLELHAILIFELYDAFSRQKEFNDENYHGFRCLNMALDAVSKQLERGGFSKEGTARESLPRHHAVALGLLED